MTCRAKRGRGALLAPLVLTLMASAFAPPAIAQETKVMEDTITIGERLTRDGRVAIYGIYFDSDQADLKPESDPVIDAIGELLQRDAALRIDPLQVLEQENDGLRVGLPQHQRLE